MLSMRADSYLDKVLGRKENYAKLQKKVFDKIKANKQKKHPSAEVKAELKKIEEPKVEEKKKKKKKKAKVVEQEPDEPEPKSKKGLKKKSNSLKPDLIQNHKQVLKPNLIQNARIVQMNSDEEDDSNSESGESEHDEHDEVKGGDGPKLVEAPKDEPAKDKEKDDHSEELYEASYGKKYDESDPVAWANMLTIKYGAAHIEPATIPDEWVELKTSDVSTTTAATKIIEKLEKGGGDTHEISTENVAFLKNEGTELLEKMYPNKKKNDKLRVTWAAMIDHWGKTHKITKTQIATINELAAEKSMILTMQKVWRSILRHEK